MMYLFRYISGRLFIPLIMVESLLCLFSCGSSEKNNEAQRLNDIAYRLHYRQLDSVKVYADSVLKNPEYSDETKAEALNNLVFYHIGKMNYDVADSLARHIYDLTDNHIELLIASVQQMRLCQRRSENKNFYEHRQRAMQHLQRINEEDRSILTPHQLKRLIYAETEMHIVESAYYYYVGLEKESNAAIDTIDREAIQHNDTTQYLAYLYNIGSGGYFTEGASQDIQQEEFEILMECYMLSIQYGYPYWQANALQALSDHLLSDKEHQLIENNQTAIGYLNTEGVSDTLLAGNLALRAKDIFSACGDIYQTSAAWRTLSSCYFSIGDYPGAVYCLQQALKDKKVESAPSLLSSIHEDMSIAFAALDDKAESDQHRNAYLDMQEKTRQDRQLEARAEQLQSSLRIMDIMVWSIIGVLVLLLIVLITLITRRLMNKRKGKTGNGSIVQNYRKSYNKRMELLDEKQEELEENIGVASLSLDRQQEAYEEHRAKMHLIDSLIPLIDRMLHEIKELNTDKDSRSTEELRRQRSEYIVELTEQINRENDFLTEWISLKQGELSLRIETFALNDILAILNQSATTFRMAGIEFGVWSEELGVRSEELGVWSEELGVRSEEFGVRSEEFGVRSEEFGVRSEELLIKADRTLTLFMLNTLCDNARKFTPRGGKVTVDAHEVEDDMIEISVSDTGKGMTEEQCENIFVAKPITDQKFGVRSQEFLLEASGKAERGVRSEERGVRSHGFGLLNCKGIIEKYKKTSPLFSHCCIGVESKVGEGTRFFFRLPKGIKRFILLLLFVISSTMTFAGNTKPVFSKASDPQFKKVYALTDSLYQSNVNGTYSLTINYAYRCIDEINSIHKKMHDKRKNHTERASVDYQHTERDSMLMADNLSATSAEVYWLRDSLQMPFDAILTLRNEIAVASLALHDWQTYNYNNKVYTQLFREMSVDSTLDDFCSRMQQTESNRTVAIMLLIILLLAFVPIFYFLYYRHVISDSKKAIADMKREEANRNQEIEELEARLGKLKFEVDRLYVSNNVMANSLSTIKHETMYFPSRISQIFSKSGGEYTEGAEVATFYRSLYEILTEHARYNCRQQLDTHLLKDMLLRKLARMAGVRKAELQPSETKDAYAIYEISIVKPDDISLRLCTQIVRDLGELFNLRRCGITKNNDKLTITIPNGEF